MWSDIKHQPQAVSILSRSIINQSVAHAYLFTGPRGTGKKKAAIQMAKAIFCDQRKNGDSCDTCMNCRRVEHGNHPDLHLIEPEGRSIKIDQIRELRKEFNYSVVEAKTKIYILVDADTMTREAANSLLKFLEEPIGNVIAILLTTNQHSMLPTILSRCQVIPFHELPWQEIAAEAISAGIQPSLARVAAQITGSVEEVMQLCHRDTFAQLRKVVIKFYAGLHLNKSRALLKLHDLILSDPQFKDEIELFLSLSIILHHDLMYLLLNQEDMIANQDAIDSLRMDAKGLTVLQVSERIALLLETNKRLKSMNPQLALEQMILHFREEKLNV